MAKQVSAQAIGQLIITSRPFSDYQDMFLLTDADLVAGPILDCPGGASPFGAQVRARGGTVVSVDPAYRIPREELSARVSRDLGHSATWTAENAHNFDWDYLGSPDSLRRLFEVSADMFFADYLSDRQRYVAATLPELPFSCAAFRLAVCSHLLFCYPEFLTYDGHLAGLLELIRVADELRVYPLVDTCGRPYPKLDELRTALAEHGVRTEIRTAACTYIVGADQLLICRREPGNPRRRAGI